VNRFRDSNGKIRHDIAAQLDAKIKKQCIKTIQKFWDDIDQNNPELVPMIRFAQDKGGKITDPWHPTGMEHFTQYKMQSELKEIENKIPEVLQKYKAQDYPFGDVLEELFVYPRRQQELTQELCNALKNDCLFEIVKENREKSSVLASAWITTLVNVLTKAWWKPLHIAPGKVGISLPMAIDAYIRDFELFFESIIRPCLPENKSYQEDLSNFAKQSPCPLTQEWVKLGIRSRLVRLQYIIDLKNEEIKFFKTKQKNKITHSIKLDQFLRHVISMNLILWSAFAVLCDSNQFQFPFSSKKLFPEQSC